MSGYVYIVIQNSILKKKQRYKIYTDNIEEKMKEYNNEDSGLICIDKTFPIYALKIDRRRI